MMDYSTSTSSTVADTDTARGWLQDAVLSRYRIGELIGHGQLSSVYRATSVARGEDVAIKLFDVDFGAKPDLAQRIEDELRACRTLGDVRVIAATSLEKYERCTLLVMPLMQRGSLAARIRARGALPLPEVERTIGEVAETLDGMHAHGLTHRGLKPENILFDGAGHACIVDVGLTDTLVAAGGIHGPRAAQARRYAAPEQWRAQKVDGRADQYALARIAYEMLTGGQREQQEIVEGVHTLSPVEVLAAVRLRKDVPLHVNAALRRALSANAANRFVTATDFANAFVGRTPNAVPGLPTAYPELGDFRARHHVVKIGGALAATLIIVFAADPAVNGATRRAGRRLVDYVQGNHRQVVLSLDAASPSAPSISQRGTGGGAKANATRGISPTATSLLKRSRHPAMLNSGRAVAADPSSSVGSEPVTVKLESPSPAGARPSTDPGGAQAISAGNHIVRDGRSWLKRMLSGAWIRGGASHPVAYIHVSVDRGSAFVAIDGLPRGAAPLTVSVDAGHHTISALGALDYGAAAGVDASGGDTAIVLLHGVGTP